MIADIGSLDDARIVNIGDKVITVGGLASGAFNLTVAVLVSWVGDDLLPREASQIARP